MISFPLCGASVSTERIHVKELNTAEQQQILAVLSDDIV
jgi:hypothetical protein